jgi:hypothetical protein
MTQARQGAAEILCKEPDAVLIMDETAIYVTHKATATMDTPFYHWDQKWVKSRPNRSRVGKHNARVDTNYPEDKSPWIILKTMASIAKEFLETKPNAMAVVFEEFDAKNPITIYSNQDHQVLEDGDQEVFMWNGIDFEPISQNSRFAAQTSTNVKWQRTVPLTPLQAAHRLLATKPGALAVVFAEGPNNGPTTIYASGNKRHIDGKEEVFVWTGSEFDTIDVVAVEFVNEPSAKVNWINLNYEPTNPFMIACVDARLAPAESKAEPAPAVPPVDEPAAAESKVGDPPVDVLTPLLTTQLREKVDSHLSAREGDNLLLVIRVNPADKPCAGDLIIISNSKRRAIWDDDEIHVWTPDKDDFVKLNRKMSKTINDNLCRADGITWVDWKSFSAKKAVVEKIEPIRAELNEQKEAFGLTPKDIRDACAEAVPEVASELNSDEWLSDGASTTLLTGNPYTVEFIGLCADISRVKHEILGRLEHITISTRRGETVMGVNPDDGKMQEVTEINTGGMQAAMSVEARLSYLGNRVTGEIIERFDANIDYDPNTPAPLQAIAGAGSIHFARATAILLCILAPVFDKFQPQKKAGLVRAYNKLITSINAPSMEDRLIHLLGALQHVEVHPATIGEVMMSLIHINGEEATIIGLEMCKPPRPIAGGLGQIGDAKTFEMIEFPEVIVTRGAQFRLPIVPHLRGLNFNYIGRIQSAGSLREALRLTVDDRIAESKHDTPLLRKGDRAMRLADIANCSDCLKHISDHRQIGCPCKGCRKQFGLPDEDIWIKSLNLCPFQAALFDSGDLYRHDNWETTCNVSNCYHVFMHLGKGDGTVANAHPNIMNTYTLAGVLYLCAMKGKHVPVDKIVAGLKSAAHKFKAWKGE